MNKVEVAKAEVIIKKVNLTKSLVSQMFFLNTADITKAKVVGMLVNAMKNRPKLILLTFEDDYYLYDVGWQREDTCMYFEYIKGGSTTKNFDNKEECDLAWGAFVKAREKAYENHIYL